MIYQSNNDNYHIYKHSILLKLETVDMLNQCPKYAEKRGKIISLPHFNH